MGGVQAESKISRRDATTPAAVSEQQVAAQYRIDRDRIATSPFFARLGGVTQVVSSADAGLLHNRLTHSLKVAQVARTIAERIESTPACADVADKLGGCDPMVAEAAALAHDLGHPPFGHLGEQVLDRVARTKFGLVDGFEGNAQTFRILTATDVRGPSGIGLDLTAAVRASVLKYPWARLRFPSPHPSAMDVPPRGAAESAPGEGSSKFCTYFTELDDFEQARAPYASFVESWQQTIEASVMDTADDIAYAIHDLQDFHRIGVLQHAPVAAEFRRWLAGDVDPHVRRRPGVALERMRQRMHVKDPALVDDDAFHQAVVRVQEALVDGLLAEPFDGSTEAEQAIGRFSSEWTERLVGGVTVDGAPSTRSGHVTLEPAQWHEVQVLKFVHRRFVLQRPELALYQRGHASLLTTLVDELDAWLSDAAERLRLPRRLQDLVDLAQTEYSDLARSRPDLVADDAPPTDALARGRAIIDFVASLTDRQGLTLLDAMAGRAGTPWSDSFVL